MNALIIFPRPKAYDRETQSHCMFLHYVLNNSVTGLTRQFKAASALLSVYPDKVPVLRIYFFVDDILLFAEASCDQAHVIYEVLNTFCASSCEKVNNKKSQVFFSKNVRPPEIKRIVGTLGFSAVSDLGKYLGMPILHKQVTKATYQEILEKFDCHLNGQSAKLLSLSGMLTLTKSVIQALP